jgi:hypothetical protein
MSMTRPRNGGRRIGLRHRVILIRTTKAGCRRKWHGSGAGLPELDIDRLAEHLGVI